MSKSLGNFYTLRDVLDKGYTGREVRYALIRVHYRAPLNFTWEGMEEARQSLARIDSWLRRLRESAANGTASSANAAAKPGAQFVEALDEDLNISAALGYLFESIRETNRAIDDSALDDGAARAWLNWWEEIDTVLAIEADEAARPDEINAMVEARAAARLAKDWRKSDELRDELKAHGWEVRDTKDGQKVTRRIGS